MKAKIYTTKSKFEKIYQEEKVLTFIKDEEGIENELINIYPEVTYHTFDGFGGAVTESSCYAISKLSEDKQNEIINTYFGEQGMGYRFIRTHLDSCDFSLGNYSAVENKEDTDLESFSINRDEDAMIPMIKNIQSISKIPVEVMLSPWSPPAFMKTNGKKNDGGSLKEEYYLLWAEYVCKYIKAYREQGVSVTMISIQNEPKAKQKWDSCVYTADQEYRFLRDYLSKALKQHNLSDTNICVWDHNKERVFERACQLIKKDTDEMVWGVAFHWYSGDHFESLRMIREKFPNQKLVFSEACIEYKHYSDHTDVMNAERYAHDIIGNLSNGMNIFLDWNITLDENGGPNHVGNFCDAPIICDTRNNSFEKKLSLYYISHFSKFIKPGAKLIGISRFTSAIEVVAAKNVDGSIAVVLLNLQNENKKAKLRLDGQIAKVKLIAHSISTVII